THICVKKRSNGRYTVLRQTIRKRLETKLNEVKAELQRRMHEPIPEQGKWLRAVVGGHFRYFGVPMNQPALAIFRFRVGWYWHHSLAASAYRLSSLSSAPHGRHYLRQEPDAGNPLVRIRGGGCEQS